MLLLNNLSIRRKLMLIIMLISTVSLLMASVVYIASDRLYTQKNLGDSLALQADMIAANSTAALLFGDPEAASETLGFLASQANIQSGVIFDNEGEVFAIYRKSGFTDSVPAPQPDNLLLWNDHMDLYSSIIYQDEHIGTIFLRSDLQIVHDRLFWFLGIVCVVLAASSLLAYTLSSQLQRVITAPLLRLSKIARRISIDRTYSLRVQGEGKDELGALIVDFNTMLDEIENRDDKLKRHKDELEERVTRRTQELEDANRQLATSRDEAEQVARRMEFHAHHDALTGLPNRILLNDRLRLELAHAQREQFMLAVLFLDLDRFKVINDSLGHATGDQLLQVVSQRLLGCLRAGDTVARLGGDEFMILLPRIRGAADAGYVGNKVIESLTEPVFCDGHELHITTSVGISIYPYDGVDVDTLVKHADISMYRAKEMGRNKLVYFTTDMNASSRKRLTLESNLRTALDNNEFSLHYQPMIDIKYNRILGFEALLRWNNPDLGTVSPVEFIQLAEESGLIWSIGEWMLHNAFGQLKEWHDAGFPELEMAVNLSSAQITRPGFESTVESAMFEADISPERVVLEITENVAMKNIESSAATLRKLRDMGVSIAMDDFGTGYSSLSHLRRLPIDTIKLDQSFVREIPDNKEDVLIAEAIIAMAKSLGMTLVVEGIEQTQQLDFFKQHGCRYAQGFLFSKPLAAEEIADLLISQGRSGSLNLAG